MMQTKNTLSNKFLAIVPWLILALSACSAPDGGSGTETSDPSGDDASGSTGSTNTLDEVRQTCSSDKQGPAALLRLTQAQTEATLRDIFGLDAAKWQGVKLSPDPLSDLGFTNDGAVLVVGGNTAKELLKTAEDVSNIVVANLAEVLPCAAGDAADVSCAESFIQTYGTRLFRRPLGANDVARYADFHQSVADRSDFATGIKWTLVSLIESPYSIYRSEIGEKQDGSRKLDNYELASELSYMLTGSTPDQALLDKAAAGQLSDPAVRRAEAERLLSTHPRFLDGMRIFFNEWLRYRTVLGQSRNDEPTFATDVSPLMVDETRFFLDTLVFGDRGTFRDLMTANFSAHNAALSTFYGWGDSTSADYVRVERPAEFGMGILAQGSLLVATSHQTATSPTLRGKLFSERFLCMPAPPPPAVVPTLESTNQEGTANTTREKYEQNHAAPGTGCGNCHLKFEPAGYTFESFDELGRRRTMEVTEAGEFPVDTYADNVPLPDGSTASFATLEELALMVDSDTQMQDCFSGLLAAYMFAGAGGTTCLAEASRAQLASGEISIYDYVLSLVTTPHFSTRN